MRPGYQPAGAEELSEEEPRQPERPAQASAAQVEEIAALIRSLEAIDPEEDWPGIARGIAGGAPGAALSAGQAEMVIERLRGRLGACAAG